MHLPDEIPDRLAPAAKAALSWVNDARSTSYELTGLVDVDAGVDVANPFEFGLILCDGELCMYGFLALWLVLLLVLPIAWFAAAVALWLATLTPGLIEIHRQFQNEPDPY